MTNQEAAKEILRALPFSTKKVHINRAYRTYTQYINRTAIFGWADNGVDRRTGYQKQVQTITINGEVFKAYAVQRALNKLLAK